MCRCVRGHRAATFGFRCLLAKGGVKKQDGDCKVKEGEMKGDEKVSRLSVPCQYLDLINLNNNQEERSGRKNYHLIGFN